MKKQYHRRQDNPQAKGSGGKSSEGNRPGGNRSSGERSGDERRTRYSKPWHQDRKPGKWRGKDKPDAEKSFSEKPRFEKTRSENSRFEKPHFEKSGYDKSRSDQPRAEKPRFDRSRAESPRFENSRPEKSHFEKRRFDKPRSDKPRSDKPRFDKPRFDKPRAEKPRFEKFEKPESADRNSILIWGFHAVRAAWLNPKRRCTRLWLSESGAKAFEPVLAEALENLLKRPDPKRTERQEIDRITPPGSVHQGIVLETAPLHELSLHDLISGDTPPDCLIMLDQVTDPHNIGAILRSAAALGAGGVILTERNAPGMTGVSAKAASGAADHVPQVHVVNLARALDELREAGYWIVGLAEEGEKNLDACDLSGRTVLVLGAEGEGLRQLTRKKCDELARLPTGGPVGSLNVSNAAAVALYEAKRQKTKAEAKA